MKDLNKMTPDEIKAHVEKLKSKPLNVDKMLKELEEIDKVSNELVKSSKRHDPLDLLKKFTI